MDKNDIAKEIAEAEAQLKEAQERLAAAKDLVAKAEAAAGEEVAAEPASAAKPAAAATAAADSTSNAGACREAAPDAEHGHEASPDDSPFYQPPQGGFVPPAGAGASRSVPGGAEPSNPAGWPGGAQGGPRPPFGQANGGGQPYGAQQPGSQPSAGQPYAQQYYAAQPAVSKDHVAAGLLAIFLGCLGIHKFYLGYNTQGFIMLGITVIGSVFSLGLAACVMFVISVVEGIIYLTKSQTEFEQIYVFSHKEWF